MTFQPPPPAPGEPPPQGPPGGYGGQPPQGPPPGGQPPGPPPGFQPGPPPGFQPGPPPGAQPPAGGFGPPPQAGGGYGPPPLGSPQGQWGPPPGQPHGGPSGSGRSFDPKSINPLDWGLLAIGPLAFIFSFINFYTFTIKGGGGDADESAWNGFFGWFAILLALIGSAAIALEIFAPQVKLPFPGRLIALGAFALSLLSMILALLIVPDYLGGGAGYDAAVDEGHGFGYWVCLLLIIVGAVLAFLRFQQSGGQLPGGIGGQRSSIGGGPGGGQPGGQAPPPSYGPPGQ